MRANLLTITREMTGNTELSNALNENFNSLNDMAHQREMAIFNRLDQIMDVLETRLIPRITKTEKRVIAIMNHLGLDPDKDL